MALGIFLRPFGLWATGLCAGDLLPSIVCCYLFSPIFCSMHLRYARTLPFLVAVFLLLPGLASGQEREALTHDVYTEWNRITSRALSADGTWALWTKSPEQADGTLELQQLSGDTRHTVPRGTNARVTYDATHAAFLIQPPRDSVRQARLDEVPAAERPKDTLGLMDLATGTVDKVERVASFKLPEKAGGWIAYHLEQEPDAEDAEEEPEEDATDEEEASRDDDQSPGTPLILRNLETGEETRFAHATEYAFSEDGTLLVYTAITEDGATDGVYAVATATGEVTPLLTGQGHYPRMTIDEAGTQVAFLARLQAPTEAEVEADGASAAEEGDAETTGAENDARADHAFSLYHWRMGNAEATLVADEQTDGIPADWHVSEYRGISFSSSGERLFFGAKPPPIPEPDHDDMLDEEIVTVDIWHHQDDLLQPMQHEQLRNERRRTYQAVVHVSDDFRVTQLGQQDIPNVRVGDEGDAAVALGVSNLPYQQEISWDYPRYADVYLIDVATGEATMVLEGAQSIPRLSPTGRYLSWWDRQEQGWYTMDVTTQEPVAVGTDIPHDLADHSNDRPYPDGAQGRAGWTTNDEALILYDRYDLWSVDPMGTDASQSLTNEEGRAQTIRFRYVDLDPEEDAINPEEPLLLSAFHQHDKRSGFYQGSAADAMTPEPLVFDAKRFGALRKAENADRLLFTREDFQEFPDLWTSDRSFSGMTQLSEANPQQADYRWGTAELTEWTSATGETLQGVLYKPDDFDADRAYPMIVYFYERYSDNLHSHRAPQAHRSIIIPSFYTSNEYVVFVPDVWYKEGYPGESAMDAIMPAVTQLAEEPWVDADNIGIQGHSWAGYQIAYMVTKTDFFKAAAGGAPVANMISAYGGIRWGSGMSRQFQYERTQSRIGGSLWEYPMRYIDNSPIFQADKVTTPLLMMHNDQDGAVPWEQGIEMFTALRRLGRPAWLINYNDEPHWPTTFANREDWQIRLQQFFDHYLKDEPAPRWLAQGVPAIEKGTTLGLEPVE